MSGACSPWVAQGRWAEAGWRWRLLLCRELRKCLPHISTGTRGLARDGDVSPQTSHAPLACAEPVQQPSPGAGMGRVKDKPVPVTTRHEETEIS